MAVSSTALIPENWDALLKEHCESLKNEFPEKIKYDYPDHLTGEQRLLFLLTQAYSPVWHGFEKEGTVDQLKYLKHLSVKRGFCNNPEGHLKYVIEIAKKYGIIQIQEPAEQEKRKLIIGCGRPKDGGVLWEHDAKYHSHNDSDTIDWFIGRNPTWVGSFGHKPQEGECCHPNSHFLAAELGEGAYTTIVDEAPLHQYTRELWKQIDRMLKPGGMFIGSFYPWLTYECPKLDCFSNLRLQPWRIPYAKEGKDYNYADLSADYSNLRSYPKQKWSELTNNLWGHFIVTKADEKGKHPQSLSDIPLDHFPESHRPQKNSSCATVKVTDDNEVLYTERLHAKDVWPELQKQTECYTKDESVYDLKS